MKNELEICLKSLDNLDEVFTKLKNENFEVKEDFILRDTYYVKDNMEISFDNADKLLESYVLVREVNGKDITLVLKQKEYDEKGNIIKQSSCKCPIIDKEKGKSFVESLGYKKLLDLNDHNILMSNGKHEIYVQDVENLGVYLEMEQKNIYTESNNGNDIEEMINIFNSFNLNVKDNNYFQKKSFDMLKYILDK